MMLAKERPAKPWSVQECDNSIEPRDDICDSWEGEEWVMAEAVEPLPPPILPPNTAVASAEYLNASECSQNFACQGLPSISISSDPSMDLLPPAIPAPTACSETAMITASYCPPSSIREDEEYHLTSEEEEVVIVPWTPPVESVYHKERSIAVGAGATSAVVGFMFGGPVVGLLVGCGTAYATRTQGLTGDVARAMGDVGLLAHNRGREIQQKYQLARRGRYYTAVTWERLKRLNRKHRLLERSWSRAKQLAVSGWRATTCFVPAIVGKATTEATVIVYYIIDTTMGRGHYPRNAIEYPSPSIRTLKSDDQQEENSQSEGIAALLY